MNEQQKQPAASDNKKRTALIVIIILAVLMITGTTLGIIQLAKATPDQVSNIRDIFIIVLAFESLLIGASLVILIIQLALLTNLIQNEVRPILDASKDTIQTVKGTSKFISEKAVSPIISVAGLLAGGKKLFELVGVIRNRKKE